MLDRRVEGLSSMSEGRPLDKFPVIRSRHPDDMQEAVTRFYGDHIQEVAGGAKGFSAEGNHCALEHIGLSYGSYGAKTHLEFFTTDFYGQQFNIGGSAHACINGSAFDLTPDQSSVLSPGINLKLDYAADFRQLLLRIEPSALNQKLSAIVGASIGSPLQFEPSANFSQPDSESLRRHFLFLIGEVERAGSQLPPLVLAELEQALIVAFLCGNQNSYSNLLDRRPLAAAPWQVRRAEQYIEANWDQPITIEALAVVTNASARTIFHSFKESRGYSPMAFVKTIRLRHARELLLSASDTETSVTAVAYACGFGNLGHFAKDYLKHFGEHPSTTLKAARGSRNQ
jgi:AraC-like DNA-binding protein